MNRFLAVLLCAIPAAAGAATLEPAKQLAYANHAFATDLYGKMAAKPGNVFFSPTSIALALAMTWDGARGDTAAEMGRVLHLPPLDAALRALMMDSLRSGKEYELRVANKLWPAKDHPFEKAYLELTASDWRAKAEPLDYVHAAEPSRLRINDWVKEQTNGKILDLVPGGAVGPDTALVLTNAIYFKGKWITQFKKKETRDEPFFLTNTKSIKAPLMHLNSQFGYSQVNGAQLVSLPYKGGALDMVLVVPDERDGLAAVEKRLPGELDRWLARLESGEVDLYMPRFKATFSTSLNEVLKSLGMARAFTDKADFSGISAVPIYISEAIHKAFVDVNEEGTEAAAATAIMMNTADATPRNATVRADHPFIYLIRERASGAILFMGRETNPKE